MQLNCLWVTSLFPCMQALDLQLDSLAKYRIMTFEPSSSEVKYAGDGLVTLTSG